MNKTILASVIATLFLAGCSETDDAKEEEVVTPIPRSGGVLQPATEASLNEWFQKAASSSGDVSRNYIDTDDGIALEESAGATDANSTAGGDSAPVADAAAPAAISNSDNSKTSGTTLQEIGVDEDDRVKIHTNHNLMYALYAESYSNYAADGIEKLSLPAGDYKSEKGLRVLRLNENGSADEIQRISTAEDNLSLRGMYLYEDKDKLVTLGAEDQNVWGDWFYPSYFMNNSTGLQFFDIQNDGQLEETPTTLNFDGSLVASRSVENTIYLVLRHYPNYPIVYANGLPENEEEAINTETEVEDFLPTYKVNNTAAKTLVEPSSCYLNSEADKYRADIITLVAVDITQDTPAVNSVCYVGSTEAVYASTNALYLATTDWDYSFVENRSTGDITASYSDPKVETDIHKFAFSGNGFDYHGSGAVKGHLGYDQNRKSFRLSESGDYLRVITYNEERNSFFGPELAVDDVAVEATVDSVQPPNSEAETSSPVILSILKDNKTSNKLETVSTLPNESNPAPLGKPGENLYATRYVGDRAYLITFRVTDPLYVLDLSDPANPAKLGELEIDGYSDYLYPVGEDLLLGVGKDAVAATNSWDARPGAWYQGVKLSLIDVSNVSTPVERDKIVIGKRGTESAALGDHHAYTQQLDMENGKVRIALPVALHDTPSSYYDEGPSRWYDYTHTGLYRYEINQASKTIEELPAMIVAERGSAQYAYDSTWNDRSRIIGDNVFYLHNNVVWSQDWAGTSPILGPQ